jgi:hypothetical protein
LPAMTDKPPGQYKVALYLGDLMLGENAFSVTPDLSARRKAAEQAAAAKAAARAEEAKRKEEAQRLAMLEDRRRKPLALREIEFLNTTKTGTALSGPTTSFNVAKVLFVGWKVVFDNRLYGFEPNQYRVDAAYIAPDGRTLGSVNDWQNVSSNQKTATFSGRVGNSRGGAFLPGIYTVNFYLNGQYFAQKKFHVAGGGPYAGSTGAGAALGGGLASAGPSGSMLGPTVAVGHVKGLPGGGNPAIELRLRPRSNGFLNGELEIHRSGFGVTSISGYVRGNHLQFSVSYGADAYYFEGTRSADSMSGTFESPTSGATGTWSARTN